MPQIRVAPRPQSGPGDPRLRFRWRDALVGRRFALLAAVIVLLGTVPQLLARPIPDVSWLLYVAERILDGARPYVDVVEVNPPLIVWLNVAVAADRSRTRSATGADLPAFGHRRCSALGDSLRPGAAAPSWTGSGPARPLGRPPVPVRRAPDGPDGLRRAGAPARIVGLTICAGGGRTLAGSGDARIRAGRGGVARRASVWLSSRTSCCYLWRSSASWPCGPAASESGSGRSRWRC